MEREMKEHNLTWGKLEKTSRDRLQWRVLVSASCVQHEENKYRNVRVGLSCYKLSY